MGYYSPEKALHKESQPFFVWMNYQLVHPQLQVLSQFSDRSSC